MGHMCAYENIIPQILFSVSGAACCWYCNKLHCGASVNVVCNTKAVIHFKLTCVKGEVSGEGLLAAKHLATYRAGEELFVESPLGKSITWLSTHLLWIYKVKVEKTEC